MNALKKLLWLEEIERGMMTHETCKPDLYSKDSWWRIAYEKALNDLSDSEIEQYNQLKG